ncbi:hypothetical protein [Actinokineospora enzanensis]|nr:hypothetical protein [Actinokineospora enzanensis]
MPVRYAQRTDTEAAAIMPAVVETRKRWLAGDRGTPTSKPCA